MDQNDDSYIAEYDELLHKLYLAIEGKGFDQFLLTIRETLGLASACLGVIDQAKKKTLYGFASGYPKGVLPLIIKSNGFVREDGVVRAFAKGPSCLFSYSEGNPNYNILTGLSFFTQKWVKASGIIDAAVISFMLNPRLRVVLIFNRHRHSGLIAQQELELLTRLKPHIEQACLLYDRACRHQKNIANIQQLVNHLDYPVAIFSPLND
ncbi:MAG: hypothetical protein HRU21_13035, partial [Pseudomonadales bacterium]|nr:hypothetical protein [Pseudomonadales bacterium]